MIKEKTSKDSNKDIYDNALKVLPGGVSRNTVLRKPYPHYAAVAKGCYVKDIDGIERIDFANNMASLIHGHGHPAIIEAVTEQLQKGTAYTLATEAEVRFAEHLISRAEGFEKIRFVNSGTEAVMAMIKASRAFTGKPMIAKAEGAYHGTYDFAEVSQSASPDNWGDLDNPNSVPLTHGTPQMVADNVLIYPFNDVERTLNILDQNADKIAAVLIDPVPHRVGLIKAHHEFINAIYDWTRKHNALMIFDEVITFRVNYGGTQEEFIVKPDLTSMGKMIGGGFPVGAFAGRSDVMSVLDPTLPGKLKFPHSGTFSANPITMTAGRVAMKLFDKKAVQELNKLTQIAIDQILEAIKIADVPVSITGSGSMFRIHLKSKAPQNYREAWQNPKEAALLVKLLDYLFFEEKIMMVNTGSCMLSTALTQKEIDQLSDGMINAFKHIRSELLNLN